MLERDIFFLLDKTTDTMFPELNDDILSNSRNINEIKKENIIYHLRDIEWLVNYLSSLSPSFSKIAIRNYINNSDNFKVKLHSFEHEYSMFRLDCIVKKMFPDVSFEALFEKRDRNELNDQNIILNLENKAWLTKYLQAKFPNISKEKIEKYICTSSGFYRIIHDYQMSIARWLINYINVNSKGFLRMEDQLCFSIVETDYAFRKSLSDSLEYLGFSYDRKEEAIETFSKNWRRPRMSATFYNAFVGNMALVARETYKNYSLDFRDDWIKLKEYDYYQKHKDSVDKYSEPTPAMLMDKEEAEELKKTLIELSEKRHDELKFSKENMTNAQAAMKILKRI